MNDEEWRRFRLEDERRTLLIEIDHALDRVPGVEAAELDDEFSRCLDRGGVGAVFALTEEIDGFLLPLFYPILVEHFIRARLTPTHLTKIQLSRRARRLLKLTKQLTQAGDSARELPDGPRWCRSLSGSLYSFAHQLLRIAQDDIAACNESGPGSPMEVSTSLATSLNTLFGDTELSMTTRCVLIAGVVSAFVEPVTGETIRQRIKDLRRRPRKAVKGKA